MIYLKSLGMGLVTAVLAILLVVFVEAALFAGRIAWQMRAGDGGSGGIGAVSAPGLPLLVAAVAGFAGGFWWQFRKRAARAAET